MSPKRLASEVFSQLRPVLSGDGHGSWLAPITDPSRDIHGVAPKVELELASARDPGNDLPGEDPDPDIPEGLVISTHR